MADEATPTEETAEAEAPEATETDAVEATEADEATFTVLGADDLGQLDAAALDIYLTEATGVFNAEHAADEPDLDTLAALAESIEATNTVKAELSAAAEAKAAKVAELAAKVAEATATPEAAEEAPEAADEAPELDAAAPAAPVVVKRRTTSASSLPATPETDVDLTPEAKTPLLVASSSWELNPEDRVSAGTELHDWDAVGNQARQIMQRKRSSQAFQAGETVFTFQHQRNVGQDRYFGASTSAEEFRSRIDSLNAPQDTESLVAAAEAGDPGYIGCGPIQDIMLDCPEVIDCLISVPEITLDKCNWRYWDRPGVKEKIGLLLESRVCDPCAPKPKFAISCPTPREDVLGLCARPFRIEGSNWQLMCDPEQWNREIQDFLLAHQVNVHLDTIADIEDCFGDVTGAPAPAAYQDYTGHSVLGAGAATLSAIDLYVTQLRERLCIGDAVIDIVLPKYARGILRSDFARTMCCDPDAISDQRIDQLFAQRGVRVQWIRFWQDIDPAAVVWPGQIPAIVLPPSSIVKAVRPTLNLGFENRDSVRNQFNLIGGMIEDFYKTHYTCNRPEGIILPACVTGDRALGLNEACGGAGLPYEPVVGEAPAGPCDEPVKAAVKKADADS